MKNYFLVRGKIIFLIISFLLTSCSTKKNIPLLFPVTIKQYNWVTTQLEKMTLKEKCGQLVFPYANSKDTNLTGKNFNRLLKLVKKFNVGGFVFFAGKASNQIRIINLLQQHSTIPLLIMGDYERGPGMRLSDAPEFPSNMAVAATNNIQLAYLVGKATAKLSEMLGVNQTLSPVVDVNQNYLNPIINTRSYSDDPYFTALLSSSYIRGINYYRVISTAKHFPGEGSTETNSHIDLPVVSSSKIELEKTNLIPFREAIDAGVRSIMTGHLWIKAYETNKNKPLPASLSYNLVNNFLKRKLGFTGIIVTDALNMRSVSGRYSSDIAAVKAIKAGNDVVLFPANDSLAITGLYNAVKTGIIPESRINESVRKLLFAKAWVGLINKPSLNLAAAKKELLKKDYLRLAREVSESSITLLKNNNLLPLNSPRFSKVLSIAFTDYSDKSSLTPPPVFNTLVSEKFKPSASFVVGIKNSKRKLKSIYKIAKKANLIFLPIYLNAKSFNGSLKLRKDQKELITKILGLRKKILLISFGTPYVIQDFPEAKNYLCAYGSDFSSQKAAFDAINGNINIVGKLPVTIKGTEFIRGSGIKIKINHLIGLNSYEDSLYNFSSVDSLMDSAIQDSVFPGAVLLVGKKNRIVYFKPFGHQTYRKTSPPIQKNTLFDLASVSKVVGTTSAAMILYQEGKLQLDKKVADYLPAFNNNGKGEITIRNLLLHNSGLPAWMPFYKKYKSAKEVIKAIMQAKLKFKPGEKYLYSDLGMITLQKVIEKITHTSLDKFLKKRVFSPLEMNHTMYNPPLKYRKLCAPTEIDNYWRMRLMQGEVHDETAYLLGGVAGHAGLFSTAGDIAKLLFTLLNKGNYRGKQIFNPEVIEQWTTKQTKQSSRGLGWDTKSPKHSSAGDLFSQKSFGHTGFTGTSVWVDKLRRVFVVLLTNRVYPTRKNRKILKFRPIIHNAIIKAVDYDF